MVRRVHLQRHHRLWRWPRQPDRRRRVERWRARRAAGALPPAPRCLPRAAQSAARSNTGCSPVPRAAASAAEPANTNRPWRWITSSPENHGCSEDISNQQTLCFRCNAGKRDGCLPTQEGAPTSAVCRSATATEKRAVCSARWRAAAGCCWRTHSKLCIADAYPVSEGHSLVIPRRHGQTVFHAHWHLISRRQQY